MIKGGKTKTGALRVTYEHDGCLTFDVHGIGTLRFNPQRASVENRHLAQMLGWKNRLGDGAAVSADLGTGRVDPQAKFDKVKALIDFYEAGGTDWAMKGIGGGKADDTGLLIQALIRVWARDVDAVERTLAKLCAKREVERDALLKELGKGGDVLAAIGEIKAERAAANKKVNAADMLADLEDEDEDGEE